MPCSEGLASIRTDCCQGAGEAESDHQPSAFRSLALAVYFPQTVDRRPIPASNLGLIELMVPHYSLSLDGELLAWVAPLTRGRGTIKDPPPLSPDSTCRTGVEVCPAQDRDELGLSLIPTGSSHLRGCLQRAHISSRLACALCIDGPLRNPSEQSSQ